MINHKKNTHLEAHSGKILYLVILFITSILLISPTIMSFKFDDKVTYEKNDIVLNIKNNFGLGSSVGKVELKSHSSTFHVLQVVPGGERVVMVYDFYDFDSKYNDGIGEIEFINMYNNKKLNRAYSIEEITYKYYEVPITVTHCSKEDKEDCYTEVVGYETVKTIGSRKPYNSKSIPKGNLTLALVTNVYNGDYIDGIWTIAGSKITKHASWNASFENDLLAIYDFNQVSGNTTELYRGIYNLSREGSGNELYNTVTSVLPNGVQVRTNPARLSLTGSNNVLSSRNGTVIMWLQPGVSQASSTTFWSSNGGNFRLGSVGGFIQGTVGGTNVILDNSQTFYQVGEMVMITFTWDIDASIHKMYFNDTLRISSTTGTGYLTENDICIFNGCGFDRQFYGNITDMKVYNRSLNLQEITQHYNLGVGLAYPTGSNPSGLDVILTNPSDDYVTSDTDINFTMSATATEANLTNSTLLIYNSENTLTISNFTVITGESNSTNIPRYNITAGTYTWNYLVCIQNASTSINTTCGFGTNRSFSIVAFDVINVTYNSSSYETDNQTFILEVTLQPNILSTSAIFTYNGTNYSTTSYSSNGNTFFVANIDIPLVNNSKGEQNNTFRFDLNLYDGSTLFQQSTSYYNHTTQRIYFDYCGGTLTAQTLNFTLWEERNRSLITPNQMIFAGSFNSWLGGGSIKRVTNFANTSISELDICISPSSRNYKIDAYIEYDGSGASNNTYYQRNYYFQNAQVNNVIQNIKLFLLSRTSSVSFIQRVVTTSQQPIEDALIFTQRYYPSNNSYETVQVGETDENGETLGFFETEIPDYRTIITKDGVVLDTIEKRKIFPQTSPYTLIYTIGELPENFWETFEGLSNIDSSLIFDEDTDVVTYTYVDTSGSLTLANLTVYKLNSNNQSIVVCSDIASLQAGILTCNLSGQTGQFIAQTYIGRTTSSLDKLIVITIDSLKDAVASPFLIMFWLILISVIGIGLYNPTVGTVLIISTLIFGGVIGIVGVGWIFIWAIIAIAIYLVIEFNS